MTWKSVARDGLPPRDSDGAGESDIVLVAIYHSHRLPDEHKWEITTGYYVNEELGWRGAEFFPLNVSYWMPKPAPPTEIPEEVENDYS